MTPIVIFLIIAAIIIAWGGSIIYQSNKEWKEVDKMTEERQNRMLSAWMDVLTSKK